MTDQGWYRRTPSERAVAFPDLCPFCRSDNISATDAADFEHDHAWRPVACYDCGRSWQELFTMTGIEEIK